MAYGKTETVACGKPLDGILLHVVEHTVTVEDALPVLLSDPLACVEHLDAQHPVIRDCGAHLYAATYGSVFEGVGDKVVEYLTERTEIGVPCYVGGDNA